MNLKTIILRLTALLGVSTLAMNVQANTDYIQIKQDKRIIADAVRIDDLAKLQLLLKNQQGVPYKKFNAIQKAMPNCKISFAMNAGMYHANFSPVGLYIEQFKQLSALNTSTNQFGNFFLQPNGVVAWNKNKAVLLTTQQYAQSNFKAKFATQSGPMLVINREINPMFKSDSDSLKIRNGVGIKNNQLYFVISREKINFYHFADIFKTQLKVDQALYLDGTVSSAFIPEAKRHDQIYDLGPMFVYGESKHCD
ncbi:phosphodiester glycosidase family protein [Acinetobacter piscicola]|uniref:phosphodiester glycosidase family protein n=1 Tax=Acinetobacter piscicola TaxID=2006115 RepID=UPI000B7FBB3A|nr:phosphodiester glycosidase family protein [Acinetobacter piscicola]